MSENKEMSAEEIKALYKERFAKMRQIGVEALEDIFQDPDALIGYLKVHGRFDRISVNNALLIYKQAPDATDIKTYEWWKENNVHVKKGEKGILQVKKETYPEKNGDKVEQKSRYVVYTVFDISQTNCRAKQRGKPDIERMCKIFDEMEGERFEIDPTVPDETGENLCRAILTHIYSTLMEDDKQHADLISCCATVSIAEALGLEIGDDFRKGIITACANSGIENPDDFREAVLDTAWKEGRDFLAMFRPLVYKNSGAGANGSEGQSKSAESAEVADSEK